MREIQLTKGFVAKVDDADYPFLSNFKWHAKVAKSGRVVAARSEYLPDAHKRGLPSHVRSVLMHVMLANPSNLAADVDHENRDSLDNTRKNLRLGTRSQNCGNQKLRSTNTSGFKGVDWSKPSRAWQARISVQMKRIHLGLFDTAKEAAQAYDAAAMKYFGGFARLNFSKKESGVGYL